MSDSCALVQTPRMRKVDKTKNRKINFINTNNGKKL